jgi:hypothetical protein
VRTVYRKTIASDGVAGLYRGFLPSVVGIVGQSAFVPGRTSISHLASLPRSLLRLVNLPSVSRD